MKKRFSQKLLTHTETTNTQQKLFIPRKLLTHTETTNTQQKLFIPRQIKPDTLMLVQIK